MITIIVLQKLYFRPLPFWTAFNQVFSSQEKKISVDQPHPPEFKFSTNLTTKHLNYNSTKQTPRCWFFFCRFWEWKQWESLIISRGNFPSPRLVNINISFPRSDVRYTRGVRWPSVSKSLPLTRRCFRSITRCCSVVSDDERKTVDPDRTRVIMFGTIVALGVN